MSDDIERLRHEMSDQFASVRSELKDLTKAMVELVRLEGKLDQVQELSIRLGTEIDELEKRVRGIEQSAGVNSQRISHAERFVWVLISAGVGLVVSIMQSGGV